MKTPVEIKALVGQSSTWKFSVFWGMCLGLIGAVFSATYLGVVLHLSTLWTCVWIAVVGGLTIGGAVAYFHFVCRYLEIATGGSSVGLSLIGAFLAAIVLLVLSFLVTFFMTGIFLVGSLAPKDGAKPTTSVRQLSDNVFGHIVPHKLSFC